MCVCVCVCVCDVFENRSNVFCARAEESQFQIFIIVFLLVLLFS